MDQQQFAQLQLAVHEARRPLNRITMQAELIKLALEGAVPKEKALNALDKIIAGSKDCSDSLSELVAQFNPDQNGHAE
ncbi:hypothetical protein [Alteromonas lipolytica]|uniref:Histidine kinase n=1 Tax=Alteromonas lipolytica TaxID=1856405 RepID=A0A1E8FHX7_9ALTE|nr:hypothetical protein [Alteromonas lipolytica]OFI35346.1 hypothetical protein BFC17_14940 [Alteromonas lipolytica]